RMPPNRGAELCAGGSFGRGGGITLRSASYGRAVNRIPPTRKMNERRLTFVFMKAPLRVRLESGSHILTECDDHACGSWDSPKRKKPRPSVARSAFSRHLACHHELYLCCSRVLS